MTGQESILKGKRILAVDDEEDILETIEDILDDVDLDTARDYAGASHKISANRYDLVVLDIMGVNGLQLLQEAVARSMPTVMLTAHAVNPDTLIESIRLGAIAYLPKETLSELDELLAALLSAHQKGDPPWKLLFEKLGDYFDERFGPDWKDRNAAFWKEFGRTYQVGRGIQQRLLHDRKVLDKGI
jgi:DNA-binding response OmpR family regulator